MFYQLGTYMEKLKDPWIQNRVNESKKYLSEGSNSENDTLTARPQLDTSSVFHIYSNRNRDELHKQENDEVDELYKRHNDKDPDVKYHYLTKLHYLHYLLRNYIKTVSCILPIALLSLHLFVTRSGRYGKLHLRAL